MRSPVDVSATFVSFPLVLAESQKVKPLRQQWVAKGLKELSNRSDARAMEAAKRRTRAVFTLVRDANSRSGHEQLHRHQYRAYRSAEPLWGPGWSGYPGPVVGETRYGKA